MTKEINHEFTDEVVCPYCGYKYSDSYDFFSDGSSYIDNYKCDECNKTFSIGQNFDVKYITRKLKGGS